MGEGMEEGPRERLMRLGPNALSDAELLAVLLGSGVRGNPVGRIAQSLLAAGGGLRALVQADPQELAALPGLGPARAAQMLAALELGSRARRTSEKRPKLSTPAEIHRYLWPLLSLLRKEEFHVLCLNSRHLLLRDAKVAEGSMNICPVDPREVFLSALSARATAIVVAHNHPSGDAEPSSLDVALTRQLFWGGRLLGIRLLDHLVLGDNGYCSLFERGLIPREELDPALAAFAP